MATETGARLSDDIRRLYDLLVGPVGPRVVSLAHGVGLLEALKQPSSEPELAERCELGPRSLEVLLTASCALGIAARHDDRVVLSPFGRRFFVDDSRFFMGSQLAATVDAEVRAALRTDTPLARERTDAWLAGRDLDDAVAAAARMHALTVGPAEVLAGLELFAGIDSVLDIAGGAGTLAIAIAHRHSKLRVTVFELPTIAALCAQRVTETDLEGRVVARAGDMFRDPFPAGHDAILFGNVLHDWGPDRCRALLSNAYQSLAPGGRLLVHEMLLDDSRDGPKTVALFSVQMLWATEGRQYTRSELRASIEAAGFAEVEELPSGGYFSVLTGIKAPP